MPLNVVPNANASDLAAGRVREVAQRTTIRVAASERFSRLTKTRASLMTWAGALLG